LILIGIEFRAQLGATAVVVVFFSPSKARGKETDVGRTIKQVLYGNGSYRPHFRRQTDQSTVFARLRQCASLHRDHTSLLSKRYLDRLSRFRRAYGRGQETETQTDHATPYVEIGRIRPHLATAAMRSIILVVPAAVAGHISHQKRSDFWQFSA